MNSRVIVCFKVNVSLGYLFLFREFNHAYRESVCCGAQVGKCSHLVIPMTLKWSSLKPDHFLLASPLSGFNLLLFESIENTVTVESMAVGFIIQTFTRQSIYHISDWLEAVCKDGPISKATKQIEGEK